MAAGQLLWCFCAFPVSIAAVCLSTHRLPSLHSLVPRLLAAMCCTHSAPTLRVRPALSAGRNARHLDKERCIPTGQEGPCIPSAPPHPLHPPSRCPLALCLQPSTTLSATPLRTPSATSLRTPFAPHLRLLVAAFAPPRGASSAVDHAANSGFGQAHHQPADLQVPRWKPRHLSPGVEPDRRLHIIPNGLRVTPHFIARLLPY